MLKGYGFHQLTGGMIYQPDFFLEVAKGNVPGHSAVNKFGHNDAVATGGEDVWMGGGIYGFYPTTAQAMEIISDSEADGPASAGALTVMVFGLDADWNEQSETAVMNGLNAVALVNTYVRMYRAVVMTAGNGETNSGNISVRIASGGTVGAYIAAGDGQTQQAIYTIPNGKTGYFVKGYVGIADPDKNGELARFKWKARPNNGVNGAWQTKGQMSLLNIGPGWWQYKYGIPAGLLPEKTDIRIHCFQTTAEIGVVGGFDLILVDDGY